MKVGRIQKLTPHDLRHTAASLAASAGAKVLALQRMLGHKPAKVTLDTYAHLFDTDRFGCSRGHSSFAYSVAMWPMCGHHRT
ncbi:tyrosine-type recombinase/integrase [Mycobacterium sp. ITM-2016-00317]|uniref:tyrosine-type recombinase/integrase n=1 Tax=Mycobacterium sp. ITM-2016-00317 TaxID=2099694 RepID=UPI0037C652F3